MLDNNYLKVQGELNKFELVTKICLPYDSLIVLLLRNDRMILEQEHSLVMDYFAKFKSLLKQEEAAAIDHKFSGLYNCISGDIRLIKFLLYNEFRNIFNLLKASILSEPTCMTDELN